MIDPSPLHIAIHYIGSAERRVDGIGMPSRVGALIECLAEHVAQVTIVAYERPESPRFEDGVEYVVRRSNVSLLSLGPKGSFRGFFERRARVKAAVGSASGAWDALIFILPNRRAHLVFRANRCPSIVGFVVGTTALGAFRDPPPSWRRVLHRLVAAWTEHQQRSVLRKSRLALINSPDLRGEVDPYVRDVEVVTLSARRAWQTHRADDRFQGEHVDVMIAGRLTYEKGVLDAVDVLAALKSEIGGVRLHVAGEGPALDAVLERATTLGVKDDLVLHGWIPAGDALSALYSRMDVFLLPSYADYEGFPCVVWEAMAHSALVVCTPVRGLGSALEHEKEVLFVPRRDTGAMAAAIMRLAADEELRRRLIASGFVKAEPTSLEYTAEAIVRAIERTAVGRSTG